jgi:hypothetical protein
MPGHGWVLHLLNARGQLDAVAKLVTDSCDAAEERLGLLGPRPALDLIVRASDTPMPAHLQVWGSSYGPGRIEMVLDLHQPRDPARLRDEILKTLFHECHHVLRWDGPGYGDTLGQALVSEGLAQCFVHEVLDCPPEPWEIAVPPAGCNLWRERARGQFHDPGYAHSDWFFGTADMPDALGYSLGALMVRRHLAAHPGSSALALATAPAQVFEATLETDF